MGENVNYRLIFNILIGWRKSSGRWAVDGVPRKFYIGTKPCPDDFGGVAVIVGSWIFHIGRYQKKCLRLRRSTLTNHPSYKEIRMSAPEKVWIHDDRDENGRVYVEYEDLGFSTPYVRADLSQWVSVDGYTELPEGQWLVRLEGDRPRKIQVAYVGPKMCIIGDLFAYDQDKVVAYRPLPEQS